jgi:Ca2+:H+ antiporter
MAKVTYLLFDHLRRHPLALSFHSDHTWSRRPGTPSSSILLCTYRAVGWKYYKYTVDGTNIFFINLLGVVVFAIVDYFLFSGALKFENPITAPGTIFALALISVIPLAYFIGQAVASISAQSSMGMGATINAFFSTIVEVYLYCIALSEGKGRLVEGSIVGSIFAGVVFMPGLSMCSGALKRKTQRFNAKSAGVTSTMLLFSVIAAFAPTLFYQIYGTVSQLIIPPNLILTFAYSMSSAVVPVPRRATHMMHNAGGVRFRKRRLQIATISTIRLFDPILGSLPRFCSFLM